MRKWWIFGLVVILVMVGWIGFGKIKEKMNRELQLTIGSDKNGTYLWADPIKIKLELKNSSQREIKVHKRWGLNTRWAPRPFVDYYFNFTGYGKEVLFGPKVDRGFLAESDWVVLKPGEKIEHEVEIKKYFEEGMNQIGPGPGAYKLQAVYLLGDQEIKSNEIVISEIGW